MPTEIGERIKQLRLAQDLTLKQVGEKAKVSATHLSEIERGKTSPTVGALVRIAHALGQEPAQLVEEDAAPAIAFVRRSERRLWSSGSLALSSLSSPIEAHEISILEITIPAGQSAPAVVPGDTGEALAVVLEGQIEMEVGGKRHVLKEGDAIHFHLADAHVLRGAAGDSRILWITRPPVGGLFPC
jgi:transcriptional regulator with XRE-family HTH domain